MWAFGAGRALAGVASSHSSARPLATEIFGGNVENVDLAVFGDVLAGSSSGGGQPHGHHGSGALEVDLVLALAPVAMVVCMCLLAGLCAWKAGARPHCWTQTPDVQERLRPPGAVFNDEYYAASIQY